MDYRYNDGRCNLGVKHIADSRLEAKSLMICNNALVRFRNEGTVGDRLAVRNNFFIGR